MQSVCAKEGLAVHNGHMAIGECIRETNNATDRYSIAVTKVNCQNFPK